MVREWYDMVACELDEAVHLPAFRSPLIADISAHSPISGLQIGAQQLGAYAFSSARSTSVPKDACNFTVFFVTLSNAVAAQPSPV